MARAGLDGRREKITKRTKVGHGGHEARRGDASTEERMGAMAAVRFRLPFLLSYGHAMGELWHFFCALRRHGCFTETSELSTSSNVFCKVRRQGRAFFARNRCGLPKASVKYGKGSVLYYGW